MIEYTTYFALGYVLGWAIGFFTACYIYKRKREKNE